MVSRQNPSVNRSLANKILDHVDHALGRPTFPMKETYRNHYAISFNSPYRWFFACSEFWQFDGLSDNMAFYSVTNAGRRALHDHIQQLGIHKPYIVEYRGYSKVVPAKSAGAARYSCFLDVSDCDDDLTFGEFQRDAKVRAYA